MHEAPSEEPDDGVDLARWLEESGRRRATPLPGGEAGHLPAYPPANLAVHSWRRPLLLIALALALGEYAYLDVKVRIALIHKNHYFVPVLELLRD